MPGPGQESVWDYPRPPRCEQSTRHITVHGSDGSPLADSRGAWRVLETSHPPTWYVPVADVQLAHLNPSRSRGTLCEWKGVATYWNVTLATGAVLADAAWSYEHPTPGFAGIAGALAFSATILSCAVDGETAQPQEGGFYGGWITSDVVGPFKGAPGTLRW